MNERRAIKVPLGMLKGKPMSTSVPTFEFRFHAAEEQLEEIYPEIEEEVAAPLDPAESREKVLDIAPVAPPRSPKPSRSEKCSPAAKLPRSLHSPVSSSPEPSPLREALKPGALGKRSTSMEAGIGESPGPASSSDTWRILQELKGKITRTVEDKFTEIKNDRLARSETRKNRLAASGGKKDDASFSDSEDASSSENSNQPNTVSTSNSGSQLSNVSGVSSLTTTPTSPSTYPVTSLPRSRKISKTDEEIGSHSRPTTPSLADKRNAFDPKKTAAGKAMRAGSVPTLVAESPTSDAPPKRSLSLRSQIKPKFNELRNRRRKPESRSNSSISSAVFSVDGEESDEGDGTDAVEEGVEALEEDWPDIAVTPSVPLGTMLSTLNDATPPPTPSLTFKQKVWLHRYLLLLVALVAVMMVLPFVPVLLFVVLGAVVVVVFQQEFKQLTAPNPVAASMNMGYAPFSYPNYSQLPILKVPAAAEIVPAACFEGWMNDYAGKYDTNSYHISLTESVFVRLEGSMLTLKYTRAKIPKRAMWNEPASRKVTFTHERHFSIRGCEVKLLPEGIARRRQWSKKYPICIVLNPGNTIATPDETADLEVDEIRPAPEEKGSDKENEKETERERSKEEIPSSKKITASAKYAKNSSESLELTIWRSESAGDVSVEGKAPSSTEKPEGENANTPMKVDRSRLRTTSSKEGNSDVSGAEDDESFSIVNSDASNCLYLFARADREKEEWYRRFAEAVRPHGSVDFETVNDISPIEIDESCPLLPSLAVATLTEYLRYMQCFHLENKPFLIHPPKIHVPEKEEKKKDREREKEKDKDKHKEKETEKDKDKEFETIVSAKVEKSVSDGHPMAWLNALVGRVCFDILRSAQWKKRLHQRLQKKLSTLKLPYFVEDLTVTELDLGDTVPLIHRTSQPTLDVRGLWVEMDITYQGGFRMTIESKLNLMKLKRNVSIDTAAALLSNNLPAEASVGTGPVTAAAAATTSRSPVFDSDLDDSAESSSDDDHSVQTDDGQRGPGANPGRTTGKKFLRMVDRIAASKYFQQATEMKYIKKAMEGVSNTRIMLSVELKGLVGTLALNLPPPPSDRLWYGFHGNPKLWLTARPTLGERQVNFNQISNWIEQKLCQEFQKVLVLPNMDDLVIPVMSAHLPV